MRHVLLACVVMTVVGCGGDPEPTKPGVDTAPKQREIGYDIRRLRPKDGETLVAMFDRVRAQATADGKQTAVLFSADWCEPCRKLDLELGNTHPAADIGHVRIFELKEEEWEAATRMDEMTALRQRWYAPKDSYPVFIVLDSDGKAREEMKEAIDRLTAAGVEPTVSEWFRGLPR